ncbi:6-phosphogluconolactonase [Asticcacaulis sp. ZE23SCel15]|uniref:6-phosphogluconolactonase n=1 Tax=Asticcacaulis sp. ZE23SCel15 TaxID=3059027 RepID=UPI00265E60E3|nr:6-phosphogluconolactonase [Asticcacaulis sp. ZE23SCel15]WKL57680.1 6-phosphogluconolactonase [Asticcacaulis sp. ZE23SCel15]
MTEDILQSRWNRVYKLESPTGHVNVRVYDDAEGALFVMLRLVEDALTTAISERGRALWIGAGGGTPKPVYEQLDTLNLPWDKVTLSQVDERFVPVDDAASNTKMMAEAAAPLIAKGMVFETLIRDITDPVVCAEKAEALLRSFNGGEAPMFDLTLLGMGPDRHYASIFPGHPINAMVYDTESLVLPVEPATGGVEPKLPRITLSVKALNRSRRIVLYITGFEKEKALEAAVADPNPDRSPIGAFLAQCPAPVDIVVG